MRIRAYNMLRDLAYWPVRRLNVQNILLLKRGSEKALSPFIVAAMDGSYSHPRRPYTVNH